VEQFKNVYDTEVPQKKCYNFRERDTSKEIQPKMRFTASTQIERVLDALNQQSTNQGPHKESQKKKLEKLVNNSMRKSLSFKPTGDLLEMKETSPPQQSIKNQKRKDGKTKQE